MRKIPIVIVGLILLGGFIGVVAADESGKFQEVKMKTFDKEKFVFPRDLRGPKLNILFLAMSADQDNGQYQQEALLAWHAQLAQQGVLTDEVLPYHFPVLESPPWFVKGIIVGAMRDAYEGNVPLDQAGVLYVDDLEAFAAAAQLALDGQPTVVLADTDAKPLRAFKGEVTPAAISEIRAAVAAFYAENTSTD